MADIFDVLRRIDARNHVELFRLAVFLSAHLERLTRFESARETAYRVDLVSRQPEALAILPLHELEREHAHPDQIAPMDPLEALGDNRPDAQELRSLRRPVARRTGAIFLADDQD